MKINIFLTSLYFYILTFISCGNVQKDFVEKFNLVSDNNPFQSTLKLSEGLKVNPSLDITIIDGNSDKLFYLKKDSRKDPNYPDRITITDKISTQFSGVELTDSIVIDFFGKQYLVTLALDSLIGYIHQIKGDNIQKDVTLSNQIPKAKLISLVGNEEYEFSATINKDFNFFLFKNWAPFCAPCIEELDIIEKNHKSYLGNSIKLIYIIDSIYKEDALKYFNAKKIKNDIYLCDYTIIKKQLNFMGFPSSVLFCGDGKYIRHYAFQSIDKIESDIIRLKKCQ